MVICLQIFVSSDIQHEATQAASMFLHLVIGSLICVGFASASEQTEESAKSDWIESKEEALAVQRAQQEAL